MAVSDPIADFLTRIRNSCKAEHRYVDMDWSRMRQNLAEILKKNGFVDNYLVKQENEQRGQIRIFLKYVEGRNSVIQGLRRVSKPGLRKYVKCGDIPYFYGGYGVPILSTSRGVMSGYEAQKEQLGGELLCLVW